MTFKSQLDDDAVNVFLNSDEFAESITYTPSGGSPKTIKAVVSRERVDPDSQARGNVLINQAEIHIAKDSTYGVASVSKGADKVSFPAIIGGSNSTWLVIDIIKHDDGMFHLLVQK